MLGYSLLIVFIVFFPPTRATGTVGNHEQTIAIGQKEQLPEASQATWFLCGLVSDFLQEEAVKSNVEAN